MSEQHERLMMDFPTLRGLRIERMDRTSLVNFQSRESTVDEVPRLGDPQAAISTLIAGLRDQRLDVLISGITLLGWFSGCQAGPLQSRAVPSYA